MQISRMSLYNKNLTANKSIIIINGSIGKIDGDTYEHQEPIKSPIYNINQITKTWKKDSPDISNKTIDATNKLFDDYFAAAGGPIGEPE